MMFRGPDWHSRHVPMWREVLAPLLSSSEALTILEIGSYEGRSAAWIAREMLGHHASQLVCVDPFDDYERFDTFTKAILDTGHAGQVVVRTGYSRDMLPRLWQNWREAFDFIYIDGSHEAPDVLFDSVMALELARVGGIVIWDDYQWNGAQGVHAPAMAIDAVLSVHAERLRVLHKGVQVAVEKIA